MPSKADELLLWETWVADNPGSRVALRLARAYTAQSRHAEAAAVLERFVAIHPEDLEARVMLAEAMVATGRHTQARHQLEAAARVLVEAADIFFGLERVLRDLGEHQRAVRAHAVGAALRGWIEGRSVEPPPQASPVPLAAAEALKRLERLRQAALMRLHQLETTH